MPARAGSDCPLEATSAYMTALVVFIGNMNAQLRMLRITCSLLLFLLSPACVIAPAPAFLVGASAVRRNIAACLLIGLLCILRRRLVCGSSIT